MQRTREKANDLSFVSVNLTQRPSTVISTSQSKSGYRRPNNRAVTVVSKSHAVQKVKDIAAGSEITEKAKNQDLEIDVNLDTKDKHIFYSPRVLIENNGPDEPEVVAPKSEVSKSESGHIIELGR